MGKHEVTYPRVDRDHYPTPAWVVQALGEHVRLGGRRVWECATGSGEMAEALRASRARIFRSDIERRDYPLDAVFDFTLSRNDPRLPPPFDTDCDVITNPPFGPRGKLAEAFIEAGLQRLTGDAVLALLLPADFDSARTRVRFFRDCPRFTVKIVLIRRIVWFQRSDGVREHPKEDSAWFIWSAAARDRAPAVLYAPRIQEACK